MDEILEILDKLREEKGLDCVFINIPDIKVGKNYFVTKDEVVRRILDERIGTRFDGNVGKGKLILRKQIENLLGLRL